MILNPLVRIRGRSTLGHLQFASMVHYKVVINWPEVVTTQVDADVDLSKYTMSLQPDGYVQFCKDGKQTSLHRMVMGLTRGDGKHVDHINGDKLDNRRCNLRIITHKQNMFNRRFKRVAKSGYRGVQKTLSGRWRAYIGRINPHIGMTRKKKRLCPTIQEHCRCFHMPL